MASVAQQGRNVMGGGDGEGVDDARSLDRIELRGNPSRALRRGGQRHHRQAQRLTVQATPKHQGVSPTDSQLGGDVVDYPVVGGGRGGQNRYVRAQFGDQCADTPIIRPEVVAPVGHTVRLVDHHKAGVGGQRRQHIVTEVRIVEPFRTDQQHVEFAVDDPLMDGIPFGDVARVDRGRTNARALGGRDLVAHQRQQRRHDDRRPAAALPEQLGGDEVDRRLTPAGALHHQGLPSLHDKGFDRRPLVVA